MSLSCDCRLSTQFHYHCFFSIFRCGNVAAIFELDENIRKSYTIFEAAPNVSIII